MLSYLNNNPPKSSFLSPERVAKEALENRFLSARLLGQTKFAFVRKILKQTVKRREFF